MRTRLSVFSLLATSTVLLPFLYGCGADTLSTSSAPAAGINGIAHGGPNPVVGATVRLYATTTTSGAYGTGGTLLGTATTGSDGSFSFSSPATCPAGQQAYVTAQGGDPGSGTNSNYLLVAALGPCSTISSSTLVWVDEVTTVAAAYALRSFTTVTTSAGVRSVNISAPSNNNAATGTCTTTSSVTISCAAAGLPHAFTNALNLANSVSIGTTPPTGTAYTVTPANPSGSVPAALINSLANSIEACVNSRGGVAGDSSVCGNLFGYTTPPPAGSAAPTDTFQAMLNVAHYPALSGTNVASLHDMASTLAPYQPTLTSAPTDYSLGIAYLGLTVSGTATAYSNPFSMTLDANDNVYVGSSTPTTSTETAMASNGAGVWAAAANTTYITPRGSGTDTLGHLWVAQNSTTAGKFTIQCFALADGTPCTAAKSTSNIFTLSVDRANNIWYSLNGNGNPNLLQDTQSSNWQSAATFTSPKYPAGPHTIAFDQKQNVWTSNFFSSPVVTSTISVFPNTGTVSAPAYTTGTSFTATLNGIAANGLAIDASGNAWVPTGVDSTGTNSGGQALFKIMPTFSTTNTDQITSVTVGSPITDNSATPLFNSIDGLGDSWIPDNTVATTGGYGTIIQYSAANGTVNTYMPCFAPNGALTCSTGLWVPTRTQVDSTGSLWISSVSNSRVVQLIGTPAPAWPQLSFGYPGVMPQ